MKKISSFALLVSLILIVSLMAGCGGSDKTFTPPPPPNGSIFAFMRNTGTATSVHPPSYATRHFRGTPQAELAMLKARGMAMASAVASPTAGDLTLYTMNSDGSSEKSIPSSAASFYYSVALSPDGRKLVFDTFIDYGYSHIFVMNVDGTGLTELTTDADGWAYEPMFTPDGLSVFYVAYPSDGPGQVWAVDLTDLTRTQITNDPNLCFHSPNISADGKKGVAEAHNYYENTDDNIYTVDLQSLVITQVTTGLNNYEFPAFTPDGNKIIVSAYDADAITEDLVSMNLDGSNLTKLTNTGWEFSGNSVGKIIVFQSYRDGNFELYGMNPDGSGQRRLTNNTVDDMFDNLWYY